MKSRFVPQPLRQVLSLLEGEERKFFAPLMSMMAVTALLDALGIVSMMPFLGVLSNPELIQSNWLLSAVFHYLQFSDRRSFLVFLGLVVFSFLLVSLAFKGITAWAIFRFGYRCEFSLGRRLLEKYVRQPYEWFLSQHSANLGKTVLSEVEQVVSGFLLPLMQCAAQLMVLFVLIVLMFIVDPFVASVILCSLGAGYLLIFQTIRRKLLALGRNRVLINERRFGSVTEIFGGIKDIKVSNKENAFLRHYDLSAREYARLQAVAKSAFYLPRYAMEALAFGGILLVSTYVVSEHASFENAVPVLALYALAGYRMMPALQQTFAHLGQLRFTYPAFVSLHRDLTKLATTPGLNSSSDSLSFKRCMRLDRVSYTYPGSTFSSLKNISVDIAVNSTIGLVGATGSGKTTTVDILLGLLNPQSGRVLFDGKDLNNLNKSSFSAIIGYVPQEIFLLDDSIAANIAFGVPASAIDMTSVESAARIASIDEFVQSQLPDGYRTRIGERGVRLSGGQRQRLGIARALYHRPQLLIFDEATSALDNVTEDAVMKALQELHGKITIVLVAHRLSTVRKCDIVYLFDGGHIISHGSYEKLLQHNVKFRQLVVGNSGG